MLVEEILYFTLLNGNLDNNMYTTFLMFSQPKTKQ